MSKRKICVVSGARSDYGLLYWILKEIDQDPDLLLQLVVTGMHLSPQFGETYRVIEEQGFRIAAVADLDLSSDSPAAITRSMGKGLICFADVFAQAAPDVVLVLGDRFEILVAATAAMMARIPIAHISGGEVTEGAIDDSIRHAITKMSSFHFVAAEPYRNRVIRMGEEPERVLNFGDPGLDNIARLKLMNREELSRDLGMQLERPTFLVTYHPVTLSDTPSRVSVANLLAALDKFPSASIVFTKPNADAENQIIGSMIDEYAAMHQDRVKVFTSLGQLRYLSAVKNCDVVIGNSSSGITEAPALKTATVNIGSRQKGRLCARSIINCPDDTDAITDAIQLALSEPFRSKLEDTVSLYGSCNASARIVKFLKEASLSNPKRFYDGFPRSDSKIRVGGDFEIHLPMFDASAQAVPTIRKPHLLWLDTGRSAIRAALQEILDRGGRPVAYLPAFCCESVIVPFRQLGFNVNFYSMGIDLASPSALPDDIEATTILYIHYFGTLNHEMVHWIQRARRSKAFYVIEDCVQASLTDGIGQFGDFAVTSYRKFAPQIDGALLGCNERFTYKPEDPDERFISKKLLGKLLRGQEFRDELFLSLLECSEKELDHSSKTRTISWVSDYLMRRTDFSEIAASRRANWDFVDTQLQKAELINLVRPLLRLHAGEVPLGYPIVVLNGARDPLRDYLRQQNVYCPVHWDIALDDPNPQLESDVELSRSILTLPIDQRLGEKDLKYVVDKIVSFSTTEHL